MSIASSAFKRLRGLYRIVFRRMREHEARLFGGLGGHVTSRTCQLEHLEPRLLLDASGPQIVAHWPAGLVQPIDHIDVTFDEPINLSTLAAEAVLVVPSSPVRLGGYDTTGQARGVALAGNLAYVADYNSGLQIIDISNPAAPVRLGGYDTTGSSYGVAVVGNLAYVADATAGLQIIDVSNPATPVRLGGYDTTGISQGVAVSGNLAYVADFMIGLQIIDVSNPSSPVFVGTCNTAGLAYGLAVSGTLAYVADGSMGLAIIDVSTPASPVLVGTYDTAGTAYSVTLSGNMAYVADGTSGLAVIDVSDPSAPVLVGTYDTAGTAYGVAASGNLAYVADYIAGLEVIEVSKPAVPVLVGSYDTSSLAYGVAVSGGVAYVADNTGGLQIIEAAKSITGVTAVDGTTYRVSLGGVLGSGTYNVRVYPVVADLAGNAMDQDGDGVGGELPDDVYNFSFTVDATPPTAPASLAFTDDTGMSAADDLTSDSELSFTWSASVDANGIARYEHRLDAGAWTSTTELSALVPVTAGQHTFEVRAVDGAGNPSPATSLAVTVDLTAPAAPTGLAINGSVLSWSADDDANGIWKYQYRVNGADWIDSEASPVDTGMPVGSGAVLDVRAVDRAGNAGPLATVQQPDYGPRVVSHSPAGALQHTTDRIDITFNEPIDPATFTLADVSVGLVAPSEVGYYDTPSSAYRVEVVGTLAYVADYGSGLRIIDVANPAAPVLLGYYDTPGVAKDVEVVGTLAYVADGSTGLVIVDVSNPYAPVQVGYCDTPISANAVDVVGDLAYVAENQGFRIIDVSNPASPVEIGYYFQQAAVFGIQVVGKLAYLADMASVQIMDVSNPVAPVFVGIAYLSNMVQEVQVVDNIVYAATSFGGLIIIDAANPANPVQVGQYDEGKGYSYGLDVVGNVVYLTRQSAGLQIIDVSNVANPVKVASYEPQIPLHDVQVIGTLAYVAAENYGLRVVRVGQNPMQISQLDATTWRLDLAEQLATNKINEITVGPGITDVAGHPMDQDGDGIIGEVGGDQCSFSIAIDDTPPPAPTNLSLVDDTGSAGDWVTTDTSLAITWTAVRDMSEIMRYEYRLNGGEWVSVPSAAAGLTLAEGAYLLDVRAVDNAGNAGLITTNQLAVDVTAPAAPGGMRLDGAVLKWFEAADANGIWKYQYRMNGGNWTESLTQQGTTGLANGQKAAFDVRAVDKAGNVGPAASAELTADYGPRAVSHSPEGIVSPTDSFTVTFSKPIDPSTFTAADMQVAIPNPIKLSDTFRNYSRAVAVSGTIACVAAQYDGLFIYNVSDPSAPVLLGVYDTPGEASEVTIVGSRAYVADIGSGFQIVDISNPAAPVRIGSYNTSGAAYFVAVSGSVAYVADGSVGLEMFDVSSSPVRLGGFDTPGEAYFVTVSGTLAYVADRSGGLRIINISNPAAPVSVGAWEGENVLEVVVSGNLAYVGVANNGLKILDVSDPTKPVLIGSYTVGGSVSSLALSGGLAYLASQTGLQVVDVSDPSSPRLLGTGNMGNWPNDLAISGMFAYVTQSDRMTVSQIFQPLQNVSSVTQLDAFTCRMDLNGPLPDGNYHFRAGPDITDIAGNTMDQDDDGVGGEMTHDVYSFNFVIDDIAPAAPANLALTNDTGFPDNITAETELAFVWTEPSDVSGIARYEYHLDGSGWTPTTELSAHVTAGEGPHTFEVRAVDTVGNVGPWASLNVVVDTVAPDVPAGLKADGAVLSWDGAIDANGIWKYQYRVNGGEWADWFAAQLDTGVAQGASATFDVRAVDRAGNAGPWASVALTVDHGPRVVGQSPEGFVRPVDSLTVTFNEPIDPSSLTAEDIRIVLNTPIRLGGYVPGGNYYCNDIVVSGDLAYVAGPGLTIMDISNPYAPVPVGSFYNGDSGRSVVVRGTLAYLASYTTGLQIIDVSNPAVPVRVGVFDTSGEVRYTELEGNLAYVADGSKGLQIIDVTNPAAPALVGSYDTTGTAYMVTVSGTTAYVADYDKGLQIIDVSNPAAPVLLKSFATRAEAYCVTVRDDVAYVGESYWSLQILDVSNPAAPIEISTYITNATSADAHEIVLAGSIAFVANHTGDLEVIDVSNLLKPVRIGRFSSPGLAHGIALSGSLMYVADYNTGIQVVQVFKPLESVAGVTMVDDVTFRIDLASPLPEGSYHLLIGPGVTDLAGNTMDQDADGVGGEVSDDVYSFNFTVDTTPPGTPSLLALANDTGSPDNVTAATDLTFTWAASSDISGIAGYEYRLDGGDWTRTAAPAGAAAAGEGPHSFEVRAIDNVGNVGQAALLDVVVDLTVPQAPTGLRLDGAVLHWDETLDANGIWKYEYRIDGGDWTESLTLEAPTGLTEGAAATFDVRAIDKAGNVGPWASDTLTPDYGPRVVSHSPDGLVGPVTSLTLTFNEPIDPGTFTAEDVTITPAAPVEVGYQDTPGTAYNVQVIGTLAYVADNDRGLRIIDVSDPAAPAEVATYDTPGYAYAVQIVGALAYVADGATGLRIIDVSNPAKPFELGYYDPSWNVYDVQVIGTLAYVANSLSGLKILDVSNPAAPVEIGGYTMPHDALAVQVVGTMAYVADSAAGLRIIDVSNPATPVQMGYYYTPGQANDVNVVGTLAYVTDSIYGIRIIDVSNPATPVEVGYYDTPGDCNGVQVIGTLAYVVDGSYGVRIIDMANPASPVQVSYYNTPGYAYGVHVVGTLAYVADGASGLRILETRKEIVGVNQVDDVTFRIDLAGPLAEGNYTVHVAPDIIDLAGNTMDQDRDGIGGEVPDDVYGFDFTVDSTGPRVISHAPDGVTGPVDHIDLTFNEAIDPATLSADDVRILLPAPVNVGGYDTSGYAYGVAVAGDLAYVADENRGLAIFDVSDPAAPVRLGGYDTAGFAHAVAVSGTTAYIADYTAGLQVIDVTNPAAPVRLGGYDTSGYAYGVAVAGNLAYVADYSAGLQIIDVSNSSAPVRLGGYNTAGFAFGVEVSGNLAYVADGSKGLAIIDVSNPATPRKIGGLDTPGSAMGVAVWGNLAFVADYTAGLQVIDVSNPVAPVLLGTYDTAGAAYDVTVSGPLAFVADYGAGLVVLDVSDPSAPQRVAGLDTPGAAHGVAVSGTRAFVADETAGLQVINVLADVSGVTRTGDATYRIDLPGALPDGEYKVFVGPEVTDLAGNAMDQNANGIGGEMADTLAFSFTTSTASPAPSADSSLPGDVNGDGLVDSADYIALKRMMGTPVATAGQWPDFDGSGVVDRGDLAMLMANFGRSSNAASSASPTPSPTPASSAGVVSTVADPSPAVVDDAAATVLPAIIDDSDSEPAGTEPASAISSAGGATSDRPITSTSASADVLAMSAAALLYDMEPALTVPTSEGCTVWDLAESGASLPAEMAGLLRPSLERIAIAAGNADVLADLPMGQAVSELPLDPAPADGVDLLLLKTVDLDVLPVAQNSTGPSSRWQFRPPPHRIPYMRDFYDGHYPGRRSK